MEYTGTETTLLLILRLIIAAVLLHHARRAVVVDECGRPVIVEMGASGRWVQPLTVFTEVGAAILLGLGLFTPMGAALLLAIAIGTNVTMHGRTGPWLGFPRWEYLIALLALGGLGLAYAGPGELSLGYQLDMVDDLYQGTGLLIALVLGIGAEALFLGAGWYPSRRAEPLALGCLAWFGFVVPPLLFVVATVGLAVALIDSEGFDARPADFAVEVVDDILTDPSDESSDETGSADGELTDDEIDAEIDAILEDEAEEEEAAEELDALDALEEIFDRMHPEDRYVIIQMLRAGVPPSSIADGIYYGDEVEGHHFSSPEYPPGRTDRFVDQRRVYVRRLDLVDTAEEDPLAPTPRDFLYANTVFECGVTVGPMTTACADEPAEMPDGEVLAVSVSLAEMPTALTDGSADQLIYAFVAETDGDPANDWVANAPYSWDFFIGTDNWWELHIDGSTGRAWVTRTDASTGAQVPTAARVAITGTAITFFVPADELGGDLTAVRWRTSSFVHDGTFRPEASGGDVLGENATGPLHEVSGEDEVIALTVEDLELGRQLADEVEAGTRLVGGSAVG